MKITRVVVLMVSVTVMVLCTDVVSGQATSTGSEPALSPSKGQAHPNKAIRIVTGGVGTGTDFTARLIGQGLSISFGQPVIVENRPTGIPRGEIVARASPDGYTVLSTGASQWIGPFMEKTPYDPVRDFSPITITDSSPGVLVVSPTLPVKSVKELIALAKTTPKKLSYGSGSAGSGPHLAAELFKAMAGVDLVRVPYKAFGVAINDLMAGEIQVAFPGPGLVVALIKSGKLRALAVTTAQPSALFPGVPTVAASGLPGYEFIQISAMFAPAKTPNAIIKRLNEEIVRVLKTDDVKEKIFSTASEVVGSSPEELAVFVKSDMARLGKVIKDAGIKAD